MDYMANNATIETKLPKIGDYIAFICWLDTKINHLDSFESFNQFIHENKKWNIFKDAKNNNDYQIIYNKLIQIFHNKTDIIYFSIGKILDMND